MRKRRAHDEKKELTPVGTYFIEREKKEMNDLFERQEYKKASELQKEEYRMAVRLRSLLRLD